MRTRKVHVWLGDEENPLCGTTNPAATDDLLCGACARRLVPLTAKALRGIAEAIAQFEATERDIPPDVESDFQAALQWLEDTQARRPARKAR